MRLKPLDDREDHRKLAPRPSSSRPCQKHAISKKLGNSLLSTSSHSGVVEGEKSGKA